MRSKPLERLKAAGKKRDPKIAVLGGGSWATALVKILLENTNRVYWWMRDGVNASHINENGRNFKYLPAAFVHLRKGRATTEIKKVIKGADVVVLAIPAAFLEESLQGVTPGMLMDKIIVSAIKGMVPGKNQTVSEFITSNYNVPRSKFVVVSGPSHAEEVAQEKLSYLTVSGESPKSVQRIDDLFSCRYIKTTQSDDISGAEWSGIMKNIFSLACGMAHGAGYGDNFLAALVANAIQEIDRFVQGIDPRERNIMGSVYLGDLLVTAYSPYSRNRRFGNLIGRGLSVQNAMHELNMVAEGYYAVKSVYEVNKIQKIDLPITSAVYHILYDKISPSLELQLLTEKLS